jgi:hypothetical protein
VCDLVGARARVRAGVRARVKVGVRQPFACDRGVGPPALAEAAQSVPSECKVEARIRIGAKVRRRRRPPPVGCRAEEAGHNNGQGREAGSGGGWLRRAGGSRPEPRSAAVAGCWFQLVGVRVDYESRAPLRIKPARCPALRTIPAGKRSRTSVVHAEIILMVGRIAWVEGHMLGTCRPLAGGGDRIEQCQHPQQKRHRRTVPAGSPRKEQRQHRQGPRSGAADAASPHNLLWLGK